MTQNNINSLTLPSQYQIGDNCFVTIFSAKLIGEVTAVHFYTGKVKYDLEVLAGVGLKTRIYNIDSVFVTSEA